MVDGDDKNDLEGMEHMKYQGEDEDDVLIAMENNPNKKTKEEKIKRLLIKVMAIHEALAKNFFESNLNPKKKKNNIFLLATTL
jgi:hypothetical protein